MGTYNTYGDNGIQLKVGDLCLQHFEVGSKVDIEDGIYIAYEGIIVIKDGIFIAEFDQLIDKWGGILPLDEILDNENPVAKIVKN